VRAGLELDRHGRVGWHLGHLGHDQFLAPHGGQRQVEARQLAERPGERTGRDDNGLRRNQAGGRRHAANAVTLSNKTGDRPACFEACSARPCQLEGKATRLEPAVAPAEARVDDVAGEVGETPPRVRAIEQLDVIEPPSALGRDKVSLRARSFVGARNEQVTLVTKAEVNPLLQVVEECDALADQLDLLDVVELQPKRAGCDRCGERRESRTFLEDDRLESGALREQGGGATDDAAADDDEVGGLGR
jgi:hypothetical protein